MKKFLLLLATVLLFASCESEITGDFIYQFNTSDEVSTGDYMTYKISGAETKIKQAVLNAGFKEAEVGYMAFIINGGQSACDKKAKDALNSAMDAIESASDYNTFYVLSEVTLQIRRINEVIYTRKFK